MGFSAELSAGVRSAEILAGNPPTPISVVIDDHVGGFSSDIIEYSMDRPERSISSLVFLVPILSRSIRV
jgi:hypothetical protein